jgi:segregation and condensation protein B
MDARQPKSPRRQKGTTGATRSSSDAAPSNASSQPAAGSPPDAALTAQKRSLGDQPGASDDGAIARETLPLELFDSEGAAAGETEQEQEQEYGLSLEELGQTYAQMLGQGELPYQGSAQAAEPAASEESAFDPVAEELVESDQCPITPLSILEAILFVGRPDSQPIEADAVAAMMRGVRAAEIEQLVDELNEIYHAEGHVLRIVASGDGFRMQLADEFARVSDRFYGSVREVKLTQAAIDCLAIIAYRPGITRDELDDQRGQPSGAILNQMVRRQLVEMRREGGKKDRTCRYYPTERLLGLAGIESLDELPLADDFS